MGQSPPLNALRCDCVFLTRSGRRPRSACFDDGVMELSDVTLSWRHTARARPRHGQCTRWMPDGGTGSTLMTVVWPRGARFSLTAWQWRHLSVNTQMSAVEPPSLLTLWAIFTAAFITRSKSAGSCPRPVRRQCVQNTMSSCIYLKPACHAIDACTVRGDSRA